MHEEKKKIRIEENQDVHNTVRSIKDSCCCERWTLFDKWEEADHSEMSSTSLFERITENGLRRLYKFILRRVMGPFLSEDITLDQINLTRPDGGVTLTDLTLRCDFFNDMLKELPLRLRSVKVKLEAAH